MMMNSVFTGGKLPDWMGVDIGPVSVKGGRATMSQGQVFSDFTGREAGYAPSYRLVTDMGSSKSQTILPGGASGHRYLIFVN